MKATTLPSTLIFFDSAITHLFLDSLNAGKDDFASAYASWETALQDDLANTIADYAELADR